MTSVPYRRCGVSGVLLPELSLGLWHNFGESSSEIQCRNLLSLAMDLGICHLDLADNYGPPPGSAEEKLGRLLRQNFASHRDELFIATKSGHLMWPGPYGDWGSRKHLLAGLDQSLKRLRLDYVDVFYSHRPDPATPLEETVSALVQAVRSGKALYIGLSKYPPEIFSRACALLAEEKIPCLIHQFRYNMLNRECENSMLPALTPQRCGSIVFSPLAQGLLTGKYLRGIPDASRAADPNSPFLTIEHVRQTERKVFRLSQLAQRAGMSLTHMALRWLLRRKEITSVLIGARTTDQLQQCAQAAGQPALSPDIVAAIDNITRKTA